MNKDLLIDGQVYISAIRASKRVGYAADYIGQLCRAKKIDARLIGKTWYVELSSLLNHKKTRKLGKRKKSTFIMPEIVREEVEESRVAQVAAMAPVSNFMTQTPVARVAAATYPVKSSRVFLRFALSAFIFLLVSFTSFAYFKQFAPQLGVENTSASSNVLLGWMGKIFGAELNENKNVSADGKINGDGIVVMPNAENNSGVVAQIKRAFSDGVDIQIDEENDSGVITPVFREEGDYEDYAFVLVPVDEKK